MSPQARRALRVDDPVAGDACHVAQVGSPDGSSGRLCDIALNEIHPNPSQPRKRFDDGSLAALAVSIRSAAYYSRSSSTRGQPAGTN